MEKVVFFAFILFFTANAEPPPISGTGLNQEQMAENVKKFSEVYKLATQLMNLGGNVLSNVQTGSGARNYDGGDNGVLGEVVRPQFRGVSNYNSEPSSYGPSSASAPSYEDYGRKDSPYGNNAQGSNIQAIMDALTRSGAKPARPEPESGASTNFLSKLFGR
uniref:Uncharacterized protein n=1 Tax=Panagrolaimus sp. JU765 TaxID=591449 RepID=A0AC34R4C7_9BILA